MHPEGILFLVLSWGMISALMGYCIKKLLSKKKLN